MSSDQQGQASLELMISSGLVALTLAGACWLLKAQWERGRCAHLVFERTREAMNQPSALAPLRIDVRIWEDAESLHGEGRCGSAVETVAIRKLR